MLYRSCCNLKSRSIIPLGGDEWCSTISPAIIIVQYSNYVYTCGFFISRFIYFLGLAMCGMVLFLWSARGVALNSTRAKGDLGYL